jgi:hypothetical protein
MVKNEELLLKQILPIWKDYPIDEFVFYNDLSIDSTVEVIKEILGDKAAVLENREQIIFNESHNRSMMLEHSREAGADYVICIDADELMSASMLDNFGTVLSANSKVDIRYFWYNVVGGDLKNYRQDPSYVENYRTFILPMKHTGKFDMSQWKYHTPRTPPVNLPKVKAKKVGFLHLQSMNERFYALKQLWYKHFELVNYNHSVELINSRYDSVVNGLDFNAQPTPEDIISGIELPSQINDSFDEIERTKGYKEFIKENYNEGLVTFGKKYL